MLLVAVTPSGSIPRISPTSTPLLLSEWTQHPASSRSGWSRMPSMAALPTLPVAHWMTRTSATVATRTCSCLERADHADGLRREAGKDLGGRRPEPLGDDLGQHAAVVRGDEQVGVVRGSETGPRAVVAAAPHPGAGNEHDVAVAVVEAAAGVLDDPATELADRHHGDLAGLVAEVAEEGG